MDSPHSHGRRQAAYAVYSNRAAKALLQEERNATVTAQGMSDEEKCCRCSDGLVGWSQSGNCKMCLCGTLTKGEVPQGCSNPMNQTKDECAKKCSAEVPLGEKSHIEMSLVCCSRWSKLES